MTGLQQKVYRVLITLQAPHGSHPGETLPVQCLWSQLPTSVHPNSAQAHNSRRYRGR